MMLKMKLILSLSVFCLALNNGMGLPTGRYMYVRCNPNGDQSNCITHRGPQMELNPDLPSRLPASAAEYIDGQPLEGEEEVPYGEEDKGESPPIYMSEYGSGYEGSAGESLESFFADRPKIVEPDVGSGESLTEQIGEPEIMADLA
ncbi:serglycin [Myripristis murdjan]|uniref:serglycin n=1 Tax=Myripristis murdjan TaxID=586833 RepID=UPI00117618A3|nr:serglycin [Myripristis murdjan]